MMTIGQMTSVHVRRRVPGTKKLEVVLDEYGDPVSRLKEDEVWRQTKQALGGRYGRDKHRRLVVGLVAPDLLVLYPKGTRNHRVLLKLEQVYFDALYHMAVCRQLARARERKERLKEVRARRRLERAEQKLRKT